VGEARAALEDACTLIDVDPTTEDGVVLKATALLQLELVMTDGWGTRVVLLRTPRRGAGLPQSTLAGLLGLGRGGLHPYPHTHCPLPCPPVQYNEAIDVCREGLRRNHAQSVSGEWGERDLTLFLRHSTFQPFPSFILPSLLLLLPSPRCCCCCAVAAARQMLRDVFQQALQGLRRQYLSVSPRYPVEEAPHSALTLSLQAADDPCRHLALTLPPEGMVLEQALLQGG
jgi:hypothetical protein